MTKLIIGSVALGMACGHFIIPEAFIADYSGNILVIGLCILLFFVGLDLGIAGTVVENFKKVGWRILIFPFAAMIGCLIFAGLSTLILPLSVKEGLAIGSGFGWYTLAPVMLSDYSAQISAISFLHNVLREMVGIMLIPICARKIGYIECCALTGAAAMDVGLSVVEKATNSDTAVYSFVMGVVLSTAVPILVPFFIGL